MCTHWKGYGKSEDYVIVRAVSTGSCRRLRYQRNRDTTEAHPI